MAKTVSLDDRLKLATLDLTKAHTRKVEAEIKQIEGQTKINQQDAAKRNRN